MLNQFFEVQPFHDDFKEFLKFLWQGGDYSYFWQPSTLYYTAEEAEIINNKKKAKAGKNKIILTSWLQPDLPFPDYLPPQSFRDRLHNLSYRLLRDRLITPQDVTALQTYFGVNPVCPKPSHLRKAKYGTRGQKATIQAVNCFIGDLDLKDFGGDWNALRSYLAKVPLPPSAIINSGGGLHPYFFLDETFVLFIEGKQIPARFKRIDDAYKGWNALHKAFDDNAKDSTRVLRAVGSYNFKGGYAPNYPKVEFEKLDFGIRYSLEEIEALLPTVVTPQKPTRSVRKPSVRQKPAKQASTWKAPKHAFLPNFTSQRAKIEWHLQYFDHFTYKDWKFVGLCLSGEHDGEEIWDKWSRQSPSKYDPDRQDWEWRNIQNERKARLADGKTAAGFGLLVKRARERGCPTQKESFEADNSELGADGRRAARQKKRVKLGDLRVRVGEQIKDLFCPSGTGWALLNPSEADAPISRPQRKPLLGAILDHIGGGSRKVLVGGKQRRTKTCVVVNPITDDNLTRLWGIGAVDSFHACQIQDWLLQKFGLTSFSYPLPSQFRFFLNEAFSECPANREIPNALIFIEELKKYYENGNFPICGTLNNALASGNEIQNIVLVAFSSAMPVSLFHTITHHTQLDPLLCLPLPSHFAPFLMDEPSKFSILGEAEERGWQLPIDRGNAAFESWEKLLEMEGLLNDPAKVLGFQEVLGAEGNFEIVRARIDKVGESVASIARWHNRQNVSLLDKACIFCAEELVRWDGGDGYEMGWCVECGGQAVTNFYQTAQRGDQTEEELAAELSRTHDLGQAGDFSVVREALDASEGALRWHISYLAQTRENLRNDIHAGVTSGAWRGKIVVVEATAGVGKSYAVQRLVLRWWREFNLLTRITTDTKKLSDEWFEELKASLPAFVFLSVLDICDCFSDALKLNAVSKGYTLKHRKGCSFLEQISELMRDESKYKKKVAMLRHEHLRLTVAGKRLVAGADVYVADENLVKALVPSFRVDLYREVKSTLDRMESRGHALGETGVLKALFEICSTERVAPYGHIEGDVLIQKMDSYLKAHGLSLSFCLEAIKRTRFGQEPRLELPDESETGVEVTAEELWGDGSGLPVVWVPKFLQALEQTMANPIHPTSFLVQASPDKRFSKLEIEFWLKYPYLPEYNLPLDPTGGATHLVLDATPNKLIYQAIMPDWQIEFLEYTVPPAPQHHIIQITGINLTRQHLRDYFKATISKVVAVLNERGLFVDGLITRKDIKEPLAAELGIDPAYTLNFRNQRGSNNLRDCETMMLFGDATIPNNAALRQAHAIWSHDTRPFATYKNGGEFARAGRRWVAADERLQAVLDQVKAEGNQGSHRLRLVVGDKLKILVIVSNFLASELIDQLNPSQVTVIDASKLHGNSKKVREALDIYHDRLIAAGRVTDTGMNTETSESVI